MGKEEEIENGKYRKRRKKMTHKHMYKRGRLQTWCPITSRPVQSTYEFIENSDVGSRQRLQYFFSFIHFCWYWLFIII